ncbi:MAG TPA: efflux RND transporter periplasmic adaptor subunit [Pseudonocardiaceae bacterium]|nr:efflux RND transporter periplasmic adaptor subunit [Pseudonocardiaceae bacterium]
MRSAGLLLAGALLTVALPGCSGDDEPAIQVGTVQRRTVTEVVEAAGTVVARASVTLTALANGTVERIDVHEGQHVKAGQVILVIDSPAAEEQLRQAQDAHAQAARAGQVRVPGLDPSDPGTRADAAAGWAFAAARQAAQQIPDARLRTDALARVAQSEAEYAAASADARAAIARFNAGFVSLGRALGSLSAAQRVQTRAALAVAERTVEALTVRAPLSGVVSLGTGTGGSAAGDISALLGELPPEAQGQAGQLLGSASAGGVGGSIGSTPGSPVVEGSPVQVGATIATITDVSSLSLTADVDETDVLLVQPGVRAEVELDAVPGASYDAVVRSVDVAPTTSARGGVSYRVRLELGGGQLGDRSPAPQPRPGMSAVVALRVREAKDAVAVPSSAVLRDSARDTVWVMERGRAARRVVQLGAQGDIYVQVAEGLEPGDRVVVRSADRVGEGQELE